MMLAGRLAQRLSNLDRMKVELQESDALLLHERLQRSALINYLITSTPYGNYQQDEMVRGNRVEAFWEHKYSPVICP